MEFDLWDLSANLSYLRIVAPFDGTVSSVPAERGAFVNPGQPLVEVEGNGFQVHFFLEEKSLPTVAPETSVRVVIPSLSEVPFTAKVSEVVPAINSKTQTFQVKADLPENVSDVRAGLSAKVFLTEPKTARLWIPSQYLSRKNDVETVMVKVGGKWQRVLVKTGTELDGKVEILAGLNAGEQIGLFRRKYE